MPDPHEGNTGMQTSPYRRALTLGEVNYVAESLALFTTCSAWIVNYLAQSHPHLGRSGSVCPFAAPAILKDALRIAVVQFQPGIDRKSQIKKAVQHYRDAFAEILKTEEAHMLHSILVLFPEVSTEEAPFLIDGTKEELKTTFVEQGLMLGEFHAENQSPGLHNPSFTPLRSPISMLVIRRMVVTDLVFLNRHDYDAKTRLRFLEMYLHVSGLPNSKAREELERAVAGLRAELQSAA